MVFPFQIEEIFPDVAAPSTSLPRRQTGSSPQGLAVTLMADYTLRNNAWLPVAALVTLLNEFGLTDAAARVAISRLARRGVLESRRHGRRSSYRLTAGAADELSGGGIWIADFAAEPESWDGSWTFVTFSMPKKATTQRNTLRVHLRWRGFAPLYDGVWVSPQPLSEQELAYLAPAASGAITVLRAQHIPLRTDADLSPVHAWDLAAIGGLYDAFVREWEPLLPSIAGGGVTGADAVRARTEVMDTYRRFPMIDPELPTKLMPPGWARGRAREVFAAVYDGLAQPAQEYVRAIAAEITDGARLDIQAHTIAEIHAGIRPGAS
ncbi:PaaX family transcriptional regulator C-terminal domain-containing protein [Actinoplanes sp. NEAU-A12]|uniref:PaaX family transcriptional regulator C-terminal domain-containing protein n=1 Tax=Actinoplanes sandaracinus TaxID=3045177 RepID=A0ABT6X1X9_9ACTN|nr:PaaX family transcriptional regulator C-terminal domain-containing protein [Actinoplanes sandaracinus]MDI6106018.1 PaaX family transcriptional regulator C-terminal domain-containing protein [Actinoplanes sandaracinus]